ncbi:hypothetical protein ASG73_02490 [Janibacter sp. Soil728]|uniref:DUF998 domain-containing protein n=1 Tax=Janibacter sp. Soil728 TaxID=1736393 RepID=UPI0006FA89B8|nr:DUF998 domain-containing protein [Janibacter sp. Soil728]KRE39227.1 hypothetical protein ASG73_02490 [Janibacter sp. Soil728]
MRRRLGGLLLLLAIAYLLGEAWAVGGWQGRPYSWTQDAISSLGVPETMWTDVGHAESTRHVAMNATFIASGARVLLATLVLAPFVPRVRWLVLPLAVVHALGTIIVGLYPTGLTAERANMHGLGAVMAIVGGAVLLAAITAAVAGRHRMLAVWTGVCALVSLLGCVLALTGVGGFGLVERLAVDAVIVWQIGTGAALLLSPAARSQRPDPALP